VSAVHPIDRAEQILRELLRLPDGGSTVPSHRDFLMAVQSFAAVKFDVADAPDSDGFVFEYGTYRSLPDPGFGIRIARQFRAARRSGICEQFGIVDESGDHDHYIQLSGEYLYPIEPSLEALGRTISWWFRDGPRSFDDWFTTVLADPVWNAVGQRPPRRFLVEEEATC
jgi:hypothetical protein